ncbi:hypothetical protein L2E82_19648 [Cichorium intybus]|uniref:Uncharacterized protein n=1 Tax=Cichorium intybus TaxID=13427 RepID=A0ACB9FDE8_CICIN|nr:hypothetical protein L2E82_19648 [Cichorium intybus]
MAAGVHEFPFLYARNRHGRFPFVNIQHPTASDETMHFVLETLQAVVREGCGNFSLWVMNLHCSIEPVISPIILNMWALHVSDPSMSIDALDVLEAIKDAPRCVDPLVARVLPYMGPILNKPQQQPDGLFAAQCVTLGFSLSQSTNTVNRLSCVTCTLFSGRHEPNKLLSDSYEPNPSLSIFHEAISYAGISNEDAA